MIREAWAETDGGRVRLRCVGGNAALKEGDAYVFATRDPQLLFGARRRRFRGRYRGGCGGRKRTS